MSEIVPICRSSSLRRAHAKGKPFVSPTLVTYVLKNHVYRIRMGITASKKTGNAVERNCSCRIIREAVRQLMPEFSGGCDLTFVMRAETPFVRSANILCDMRKHLSRSGVSRRSAFLLQ